MSSTAAIISVGRMPNRKLYCSVLANTATSFSASAALGGWLQYPDITVVVSSSQNPPINGTNAAKIKYRFMMPSPQPKPIRPLFLRWFFGKFDSFEFSHCHPTYRRHGCADYCTAENREPYSPHAAKASLNARSPGGPFSMAMMARRWLT